MRSELCFMSLGFVCACFGDSGGDSLGPVRCARPASVATANGCAVVYGAVTDARGQGMDGLEGSVRVPTNCGCLESVLSIDDRGLYSTTLYRTAGARDTATVTVIVLATNAKYPRHVTGAPYFDTLRVLLRFAPLGGAPTPVEANLRITIPAGI